MIIRIAEKKKPESDRDSFLPRYAHGPDEDAGMDLRARLPEPLYMNPHKPYMIPTGIFLEIPSGFEGQIRSRSGLALHHGVSVVNSPGTVDPSFRGEICVILSWSGHVNEDRIDNYLLAPNGRFFTVNPGDRVAQLVIGSYERIQWELVEYDSLKSSSRGSKGHGSTGV